MTHLGAALAGAAAGGLAAAEAGGESAALGRTAPPAGNPGAGLGPPTAPAGLGPCRRLYNATSTMQLVPNRQGFWGGGGQFFFVSWTMWSKQWEDCMTLVNICICQKRLKELLLMPGADSVQ